MDPDSNTDEHHFPQATYKKEHNLIGKIIAHINGAREKSAHPLILRKLKIEASYVLLQLIVFFLQLQKIKKAPGAAGGFGCFKQN